jgi:FkbM family methyltransferase
VTDAVKRRAFERRLHTTAVQTRPLEHIGSDRGGWVIPEGLIDGSWTCYCVGAGGDITFDAALVDRGATVRTFDPFSIFRDQALAAIGERPNYSFRLCAVMPRDGPVTMYGRQDEVAGAVSSENIYRTSESFTHPGRSIPSLMRELGDRQVDLLKLDIEGGEYALLETLDAEAIGLKVLCVEFHHTSPAARALAIIDRLRAEFDVAHLSDRSDMTFVRRLA